MKTAYPIIIKQDPDGSVSIYIPDFNANTQGDNLAHGIEMARDAIGLMAIDMQDDKKPVPTASDVSKVKAAENEVVSLVDVDFNVYRKKHEQRVVRRNVTLPSWLNDAASKQGINVSAILQKALKDELQIHDHL